MELNLTRPLVVFDVESTGLNITKDRIIELSYVKVFPDGHEEENTFRFNPGMPIPAASIAVHHITDADVAACPSFAQMAPEIARIFDGCDIAGFNSNHFDIPLLAEEMANAKVPFDVKACRFIDVQTIFHKKEKRDLEAACRFYCGVEMENHHNAMADARTMCSKRSSIVIPTSRTMWMRCRNIPHTAAMWIWLEGWCSTTTGNPSSILANTRGSCSTKCCCATMAMLAGC